MYVACICLSVLCGYQILLVQKAKQFLVYLPMLVNLGIFIATLGRDLARRNPSDANADSMTLARPGTP